MMTSIGEASRAVALESILQLAVRMRDAQKLYFRTRRTDALKESKALEHEFDRRVADLLTPSTDLFNAGTSDPVSGLKAMEDVARLMKEATGAGNADRSSVVAVKDLKAFAQKLKDSGVLLAHGEYELKAAFFSGLKIVVDDRLLPGVAEFRNSEGEVISRIVGLG